MIKNNTIVSFVVIARNEEFGIEKCLSSLAMIDQPCQVICVDSGSKDQTVSVMKRYKEVISDMVVIIISGYSNAAIARNIGMRYATGDVIFFLDGDVEIDPLFIKEGLKYIQSGVDCVTGNLREFQYNEDFSNIIKEIDRFNIKRVEKIYASGGCFLLTRKALEECGFFDERLERSQDYDYTLRLSKSLTMYAIPNNMGIHHTIGYDNKKRIYTHLKKFHACYFGASLRKNILNLKGIAWLMTKRERGISLGIFILLFFAIVFNIFGFKVYPIMVSFIGADLLYGVYKKDDLFYRLYLHYIFPVIALFGFFYTIDRRSNYTIHEL